MNWEDFDFFGFQASEFSMDVRDVVVKLYISASAKLEELEKGYEKETTERRKQALSEEEHDEAFQSDCWEEELQRQRQQALGALALDCLSTSLEKTLNSAKTSFDNTHPRGRLSKLRGKHLDRNKIWLSKLEKEYLDRFKIKFQDSPVAFTRIEEIVRARDSGIHREGNALATYMKKVPTPRFIEEFDGKDSFWVTPQTFLEAVNDAEKFVEWVISELEKLRGQKVKSS